MAIEAYWEDRLHSFREFTMKTLKALAVVVVAFFATPLLAADPPAVVGRLNHISGPVSFAPADANDDWGAAALNRPITTGDRLWADSGARAEMHVGSAAVRLSQVTSVDVLNLDDRDVQLRLAQGSVNVRLRNLPAGNNFEVDTPHGAVLLTRPGSYRISVDPSGSETTVAVRGGQADVLTSESRFSVQSNQQARITGAEPPSYDIATATPMDEFDRWAAARDQKEDRIASTRYVPPEMTGYEDLDEYGTWRTVPSYGTVWVPAGVAVGWAPYRYGHWVWISPWGWTWVDDAPWGFAPFHYGRWVWIGSYWAWAPGPVAVRPVYAPALVAFIGGSNFSVAIGVGSAPAVAWVPLGWREPYVPWYRTSHAYVRNVNIAHVRNINVTNINVTNINYVNRSVPSGVTVARRENFVSARPVEHLRVSSKTLASAPVTAAPPVRTPQRASFAPSRSGPRPPATVAAREVVAAKSPPAGVERAAATKGGRGPAAAPSDERPRVRVVSPQREKLQVAPPAAQVERSKPEPQAKPQLERRQPEPQAKPQLERRQPEPQAKPQLERKAPAPPPEVSRRPTFDRDQRATTPVEPTPPRTGAPRPQQQVEREAPRESGPPRAQPRPEPEPRVQAPPPAAERRAPAAPPAASAPRPPQQAEREIPRGRAEEAPPRAQPRPQPERRQPPPVAERPAPHVPPPQAPPQAQPERRVQPPPAAAERRAPPGPPPQAQAPSARPAPHPEPRREAPPQRQGDGGAKKKPDQREGNNK